MKINDVIFIRYQNGTNRYHKRPERPEGENPSDLLMGSSTSRGGRISFLVITPENSSFR